jgi:chromosome segregation ATPase
MDNYSIKSVAFGGFDKQDVIRYIEQSAQKASAVQQELEAEVESLRNSNITLSHELETLRSQLEDVSGQRDQLQIALETEVGQWKAEAETLRADADAYVQFRERLGTIECEARKRAADLEAATLAQLQQTVDLFRAQYQILMSTFETTASHVNSELRKVEVNLSQLPRSMDQVGSELNTLAAQLRQDEN